MKFLLKRRLNPFLLLTTIVALSLLTAVTIVQSEGSKELSTKLNKTQDDYKQLNQSYVQIQEELNTTRYNEKQLQEQISELKNQLDNRSQSTESLEQRITELENKTQTLREERNEYRDDYNAAKSDILQICEQEESLKDSSEAICNKWKIR